VLVDEHNLRLANSLQQQGFVNTSHQFLYARIAPICIALGLFFYTCFYIFVCIHGWLVSLDFCGLKFAFEFLSHAIKAWKLARSYWFGCWICLSIEFAN
jgi:hypothetical protein